MTTKTPLSVSDLTPDDTLAICEALEARALAESAIADALEPSESRDFIIHKAKALHSEALRYWFASLGKQLEAASAQLRDKAYRLAHEVFPRLSPEAFRLVSAGGKPAVDVVAADILRILRGTPRSQVLLECQALAETPEEERLWFEYVQRLPAGANL